MHMRRNLVNRQRMCLFATGLAEDDSTADVDWHLGLQIRQAKGDPAVAAVGRAQQREERLVLVDGQELPVALRPAFRGEIEADYFDFAEEWSGHAGREVE